MDCGRLICGRALCLCAVSSTVHKLATMRLRTMFHVTLSVALLAQGLQRTAFGQARLDGNPAGASWTRYGRGSWLAGLCRPCSQLDHLTLRFFVSSELGRMEVPGRPSWKAALWKQRPKLPSPATGQGKAAKAERTRNMDTITA